jgi:hypothetical protein
MRRTLLWTLLGFSAAVLAAGILVNVRAGGTPELPPPDAARPITLPDGAVEPLAELVARLKERARGGVEPLRTDGASGAVSAEDGRQAGGQAEADPLGGLYRQPYPGIGWGPVFQLAEHHRQGERLDQALALYQSIGPDEPDYGIAQRRIAWDILTLDRGDPAAAVPYVHRALAAEPTGGNSWQDCARVYGRTLGLPLD